MDVLWLQNSMFVEILRCILCCSSKDCHETERAPGRQTLYSEHRITTLLSGILVLLTTIYCVEMIQANSITTDITRMYQLVSKLHSSLMLCHSNPNMVTSRHWKGIMKSLSLKSSRPPPPSSSYYTCSSSPNKSQSLTQLSSFPEPASALSTPFLSPKGPPLSSSSTS